MNATAAPGAVPLGRLLREALPGAVLPSSAAEIPVTAVEVDSRRVRPGAVFVAVPGTREDGLAYVADAVRRGAVAVVARGATACPVPVIPAADPAAAAADLAAAFHGHPARALRLAGITGTNGKTTTAFLLQGALQRAGRPAGLIGTVEYRVGARVLPASHTTPGPVDLHALLAGMRDAACTHAVMEVSSHALHQGRVRGLEFAVAVFTNLTGDHLDYHGSMEAYLDAKALLFEGLGPDAVACIRGGDAAGDALAARSGGRVLRWGFDARCEVRAESVECGPDGVRFVLVVPGGRADVRSPLLGRHNVENLLAAAAAAHGLGLPVDVLAPGLGTQTGVPGRLERVDDGSAGFRVLVDYAHTDDALRRVLEFLRPVTPGALRVLGGCGGDRDRTKRPRMARAMAEGADDVILTSDNPRSEDPGAILEEMRAGLPAGASAEVIPDRRRAIEALVARARPGDTLLIAGKGHETVQIVGPAVLPFDDREEARRALRARAGRGP